MLWWLLPRLSIYFCCLLICLPDSLIGGVLFLSSSLFVSYFAPINPNSIGGEGEGLFGPCDTRFSEECPCSHNNYTALLKQISLFDTALVMTDLVSRYFCEENQNFKLFRGGREYPPPPLSTLLSTKRVGPGSQIIIICIFGRNWNNGGREDVPPIFEINRIIGNTGLMISS